MNALVERLYGVEPVTPEEIKQSHLSGERDAIVERLYRALFCSESEDCALSSTGAKRLIDKDTKQVLFYSKPNHLPQDLGMPQSEGTIIEKLFYLLDKKGGICRGSSGSVRTHKSI